MKLIVIVVFLIFPCFVSAQGSWYHVTGAPLSVRIDDVSFINDSTGWLAADQVFKTMDKGNTWITLSQFPHYTRAIEFINNQTGFIGTLTNTSTGGLFKTTNGGINFTRIDSLLPVPPVWGICGIAHLDSLVIAVGSVMSESKLYKSADAGNTWTFISLVPYASSLIDVHIIDSMTYLVGGQSGSVTGNKAVILKTSDGGTTWNTIAMSTLPDTYCWKIFMGENNIGFASIEDFNGAAVFKTTDSGNSWAEQVLSGAIQDLGGIGMLNDTTAWVASQHNTGMYQTTDGGINWTVLNSGLNINRMVKLDSVTMLAVGNTVYKYISSLTSSAENLFSAEDYHSFKLFPNPASDRITVDFELNSSTPVLMKISDVSGKFSKSVHVKKYSPGKYQLEIPLKDFSNGTWILYIVTNEQNYGRIFQISY